MIWNLFGICPEYSGLEFMPSIYLYNTLSRNIQEFKSIKKGKISLYTCGPTVYNYAHIGNLRTYIFEDILKRTLIYNSYAVKHIMNITDVGHLTSDADVGEDKMEKGSRREGKTAWEIAEFYTKAFFRDLTELNILAADEYPRATDHIKEQIDVIKKLEKKGFTYHTTDGIYFDSGKLLDYGKLARLKPEELRGGARIELGAKKHITDFALWKFSPALTTRHMEWKSPWGVGFPGWHIECSAMSVKYLGQPFDIHCGGIDHIPVHHTNEIAQSEAAFEKPLATYWLHGEFLVVNGGDKMAKSGENFLTLQTLKDKGISPLAYRYFCLQTHYRKPLTFSWAALQAAQNGLNHFYNAAATLSQTKTNHPVTPSLVRRGALASSPFQGEAGKGLPSGELPKAQASVAETFLVHLNSDLDTPAALALVWQALRERSITLAELLKFDEVLGLQIQNHLEKPTEHIPEEIQKIIAERDQARASKDWARSDELRKQLEAMEYEVKDTKEGTKVTKN